MGWLKRLTQDNHHERLSEYVDGRLNAEQAAKVEAQLATSDEARTEVAELRAVADLLHRTPTVEAPRSFMLSHAPLPLTHAPRQHRQGLRGLSIATAAAVLALVLVTSADIVGLVDGVSEPPTTGAPELTGALKAPNDTLTDTSNEEARLALAPAASESELATAESQAPGIQQAPPAGDSNAGQESQAVDWLKLSLSILAGALGLATLVLFWMPERPLT